MLLLPLLLFWWLSVCYHTAVIACAAERFSLDMLRNKSMCNASLFCFDLRIGIRCGSSNVWIQNTRGTDHVYFFIELARLPKGDPLVPIYDLHAMHYYMASVQRKLSYSLTGASSCCRELPEDFRCQVFKHKPIQLSYTECFALSFASSMSFTTRVGLLSFTD